MASPRGRRNWLPWAPRGSHFPGRVEEELVLSQLPCWADLTPGQYRERIAELVEEIESEARAAGSRGDPAAGSS